MMWVFATQCLAMRDQFHYMLDFFEYIWNVYYSWHKREVGSIKEKTGNSDEAVETGIFEWCDLIMLGRLKK